MSRSRKRRRREPPAAKPKEPIARERAEEKEKAPLSKKGLGILGWILLFVAVYFGGRWVSRYLAGRRAQPDAGAPSARVDREIARHAEERRLQAADLIRERDDEGAADALKESLALFQKAGADDVMTAPARRQLAEVLVRLGRGGEIETDLEAWAPRYPRETWPREFLAESRIRRGIYPDALRAIDDTLKDLPGNATALRRRVEVLTRMGKKAEIPGAVDAALASAGGGDRETRIQCLRALLKAEAYDRVLSLADGLLAGEPANPLLRFARAKALASRGQFAEAEKDFESAAGDPEFGEDARYEQGLAALGRGGVRDALQLFGGMLIRDPMDTRAATQYAAAAKRLGLEDQAGIAEAYLAEIRATETGTAKAESLESEGKPIEAALVRADRLERIGRVSNAEAVLESVSLSFPNDPRPKIAIAKARLVQGLAEEALRAIEGIGTPEALVVRARALAKLDRRDEAVATIEAAARDPASHTAAAIEMGEILLDPAGPKPLEAQTWFEDALDAAPEAALFGLARVKHALGDFEAALADLAAAGDGIAAGLPVASWKVRVLVALDRRPDAEAALAAVPAVERGGAVFREARAAILRRKGDPEAEQAERDAEAARSRDERILVLERDLARSQCPDAARILESLGRLCEGSGLTARAARYAILAADCDPADPDAPRLVADTSRNPILAFRELHWLGKRIALAPDDGDAKARMAALRERLALAGTPAASG